MPITPKAERFWEEPDPDPYEPPPIVRSGILAERDEDGDLIYEPDPEPKE